MQASLINLTPGNNDKGRSESIPAELPALGMGNRGLQDTPALPGPIFPPGIRRPIEPKKENEPVPVLAWDPPFLRQIPAVHLSALDFSHNIRYCYG
jgi:hypothetical protein